MVASAAAIQAPIERTSRTRPRLKATRADMRMTPKTPRSTMLKGKLLMAARSRARRLGETLDQFGQMVDGMQLQLAGQTLAAVAERRDQGVGKAQFLRLLQALLDLADGANLAPQADFTEHHHAGGNRPVEPRGYQGRGHGQIGGRLADSQTPGDVQIHLIPAQGTAAASLQNSQNHGQTRLVPPHDGAPRRAGRRGGEERLDFHQHGPAALDPGENRGPADFAMADRKSTRLNSSH